MIIVTVIYAGLAAFVAQAFGATLPQVILTAIVTALAIIYAITLVSANRDAQEERHENDDI